ncbi:MAG: glycosyltransferase family 9 protein [Candidatus Kapaibacterium sp.]
MKENIIANGTDIQKDADVIDWGFSRRDPEIETPLSGLHQSDIFSGITHSFPANFGVKQKLEFGIALFHNAGDILCATPVARQLKHDNPHCHITWYTAKKFAFTIEHNPYIDEVVLLDGDPVALDEKIPELKKERAWTSFYTPAPYMNYNGGQGATLAELTKSSTGLQWTVPFQPVMCLTDQEVAEARAYMNSLPQGLKILVETEFSSNQSPWDVAYESMMIERLRSLNPIFIFTAKNKPKNLDAHKASYEHVYWCDLPFRHNAELYNLCDAFIGVSSGISCLSLSTWCRNDIPSVEVVYGAHWSTFPHKQHQIRKICLDAVKFDLSLNWLELLLSNHPDAQKTSDTTYSDIFISKREGKFEYASAETLPVDYGRENRIHSLLSFLQERDEFVFVFGGIGDALIALSKPLDDGIPFNVISCMNSPESAKSLLQMFPLIKNVVLMPPPPNYHTGLVLRHIMTQHSKCVSSGITPSGVENETWKPGLDITSMRGVSLYPNWVADTPAKTLTKMQVVLAPRGSVYGRFRSNRNTIHPRYWKPLLECLEKWNITPVVIGTPNEASLYPLSAACIDMRSFNLSEQMELIRGASCVIATDSWHKTFSAMAHVPTVVFESITGHDLDKWVDDSTFAFIKPWQEILHVQTFAEAIHSIAEILDLPEQSVQSTVQRVKERRRAKTLPPLSMWDHVFTQRAYDTATDVLVRCDNVRSHVVLVTNIIHRLKTLHPRVKITVSANKEHMDIFRYHPDVSQVVERNSAEEFMVESVADEMVEYGHIIELIKEHGSTAHIMDVMAGIAGLEQTDRSLTYVVAPHEKKEAAEIIHRHFGNERTLRIGLHGMVPLDMRRSYTHLGMLCSLVHQVNPNIQFIHFGELPSAALPESVLDCVGLGIPVRTQFAMIEECDIMISVDTEFYSIASNLFHKPTILIAGPTNEMLIGDETATNRRVVRNTAEGCHACYDSCKTHCIGRIHPALIVQELAFLLDPSTQTS